MKKSLLVIFFGLFISFGFSQNMSKYGKYYGTTYSQKDFKSGSQIWSGAQDKNGIVYFGNNNNILSFNGLKWSIIECDSSYSGSEKYKISDNTKVTKIFSSASGKIYVGKNNNFGEIVHSKKGQLIYHPLFATNFDEELGQVWNILEIRKTIYFVGENKIYSLKNKQVKSVEIPDVKNYKCKRAIKLNDGILFVYRNKDLEIETQKYLYFSCKSKEIKEIFLPKNINELNINGVVELNSEYFIFNFTGEVYKLKVRNNELIWNERQDFFPLLKNHRVNSVNFKNDHFYVGTEAEGVFIFDINRNLIKKLNTKDGMENLIVYDLFHDNEDNLWICLDDGIHFFETSSPITSYEKKDGLFETINSLDTYKNDKYFASKTGILTLFTDENKHEQFKSTNLLNQEVFDLRTYTTDFGDKTIAIGFDGIYEVDYTNKKSALICSEYAWVTYQNPLNKNEFFVGLENSLGKLTLKNNSWNFETLISNTGGNVNNLTSSKGKLIFGVKKSGLFIFDIKSNKYFKTLHTDNKIISSSFKVEKFRNKVYVGMETGLYFLSEDFRSLIPFKEIHNHFLGNNAFSIHRILNIDDKQLYIVIATEKSEKLYEHGFLEFENNKWKWTSWPFEYFYIHEASIALDIKKIDKNNFWFANNNILFNYNNQVNSPTNKKFKLSFDEIYINNQIKVYNPFLAEKIGEIDYKNNSIKFVFHANSFIGLKLMKYRYKLDNYTDDWSEWSELNFADFKKLSEGEYTLKVQAQNVYGFESEILTYKFTILPPWYRTWWAYVIYSLTFIFLIYLTIQLSIKRIKNQNIKLEETVKERTSEIASQNEQLEVQKDEITQKTKDIVDSIVYAKRIQETILPTKERLNSMFDSHFVFYRPKDIVSGDFYWARKKGNLAIFSALDCTGHGVPGALVSIVGNGALLRCVNEHQLTEPSQIADKLREIVVKSFDKTGNSDVKDGMDMSLCTLDLTNNILKYAGANNECFIIRNHELIELKPDKQPIGKFSHAVPFTQKEIQLQKGDCVYQYTDGFVDQFGGERGKKLKSRPFKDYINLISHLSMAEQEEKLTKFFDSWIENYDQVDDVCVFAIKI